MMYYRALTYVKIEIWKITLKIVYIPGLMCLYDHHNRVEPRSHNQVQPC